ncbi:MAG: transporter substrate-binding domain-containing protein [Succinivibrionaceae bacterium]|nr:transporter substrate-binding domain-containing protein [Succinivibrionaceae bacterium]
MRKSLWRLLPLAALILGAPAGAAELRVGTDLTFPPYEFVDDHGEMAGFDIDVMRALGKEMELDIKFVPMPFQDLVSAINSAQIDAAISCLGITPERLNTVSFSEPYARVGFSLLLVGPDCGRFSPPERLSGHMVCAETGSTGTTLISKYTQEVQSFSSMDEALGMLRKGKCAAIVNDHFLNLHFVTRRENPDLCVGRDVFDPEDVGVAVSKQNNALLDRVNRALTQVKSSGALDRIMEKWFHRHR